MISHQQRNTGVAQVRRAVSRLTFCSCIQLLLGPATAGAFPLPLSGMIGA